MSNKRVLYLLSHAPHYREPFLRGLGQLCRLTVFAKPCGPASLTEPAQRLHYEYHEAQTPLLANRGMEVSTVELELLFRRRWDVVCLGWNLHHVARPFAALSSRFRPSRWLWAGMFYGRRKGALLGRFRTMLLNRSDGVLAYSEEVKDRLLDDGVRVPVFAFNNSEVSHSEFRALPWQPDADAIHLLFVGRYQPRKRLERLVELARRRSWVKVRIIGPGMEALSRTRPEGRLPSNLEILGPRTGDELLPHMQWADAVANPGHLGLLVTTAARFGRPVLVDRSSEHAAEISIAERSDQILLDWSSDEAVDDTLTYLRTDRDRLRVAGDRLLAYVQRHHTVENMVNVYAQAMRL